jgi:nuclear pore complex protein Nup205
MGLYKFVRMAGDLLPPPLYIPYINMLAGLANGPQAAHHCYNLLKSNGLTTGHIKLTLKYHSAEYFYLKI